MQRNRRFPSHTACALFTATMIASSTADMRGAAAAAAASEDPGSTPAKPVYNPLTAAAAPPPKATPANERDEHPKTFPEKSSVLRDSLQLDLGLAVIGVGYEHMLARNIAFQVEAHYFATWFGTIVDKADLRGFGGGIRTSFFLTGDGGPRGVYLTPFLRIDRVSAEKNNVTSSAIGFSTGFFLGYSFMLGSRVNLRVGAGGQYLSYGVDVSRTRAEFRSLFPALDLVVGYVF